MKSVDVIHSKQNVYSSGFGFVVAVVEFVFFTLIRFL